MLSFVTLTVIVDALFFLASAFLKLVLFSRSVSHAVMSLNSKNVKYMNLTEVGIHVCGVFKSVHI